MASQLRVEFVRLSKRDSNGLQNLVWGSNAAPATATISTTALTTTGKIDVPANLGSYDRFHVRLSSDVACVVTIGPDPGDTSLDATLDHERGIFVPPNTPVLVPVEGGWVISAITEPFGGE